MVVAGHSKAVPDGFKSVRLARAGGVLEPGEFGALHDQDAAVGFRQDSERFVQALGEDGPLPLGRVVKGDFATVKRHRQTPVVGRAHGAHLRVDPLGRLHFGNLVEALHQSVALLCGAFGLFARGGLCFLRGGGGCGILGGGARFGTQRQGRNRRQCGQTQKRKAGEHD